MIQSFKNRGTADIYNGLNTKAARRTCPKYLWEAAQDILDQLYAASDLRAMMEPSSLRLEALLSDRAGQHSVRINKQYRVCFRWQDDGAHDVEIEDYHK